MFLALTTIEFGLGLSAVSILVSTASALFQFYVGIKLRKIDSLEACLEEKADQLIDSKFATHASALEASIKILTSEVARINERLKTGDLDLESLGEKNHRIELTMAQRCGHCQKWLLENLAPKSELCALARKLDTTRENVDHLAGRFDQRQATVNQ